MNEAAHPKSILVIDDEEIVRQSFCDQLEDLGYQVLTAAHGRAGMELIEQGLPDLVLTDLRMPVMDGLDVIRQSRECAPDMPIIVISGTGRVDDAVEALRLGAYDYLVKPVDGLQLLEHTVAKALEKAKLLHESRVYQGYLEELVRERTRDLEQANTHLAKLNARLRESEQRFREMADMLPLTIGETDTNGNITYANRKALDSFGYTAGELEGGLSILDMIAPRERGKAASNAMKIMQGGEERSTGAEYAAVRKDGSIFPVLIYSAPILSKGKPIGMRIVVVDIAVLKQQQEQVLHHAHFDSLTNLPNRFLALDRLAQLIKEAQRSGDRLAVLFLDLDGFKKINDTLGHETGDKLLVQAAERLRDSMRDDDTVGRLGGDEFIVLLGDLKDAADARPVAKNLLDQFRDTFLLDGRELILTASLGIAVYPEDGDNPTELIRNADSAMYYSKEQGRNTYHYFTDHMNRGAAQRLMLEEHLYGAFDRGELHIQYQPLVEIPGRTIVGAEALLRWTSPALGNVPPEEFIPILEQNGQIVPIGRFVIIQALTMAARWQQRQEFKIAVNLSPHQFRDPGLLQYIENALLETGTTGDSLELEITEGVLMSGHARIDDAMAALSELGVSIAMDDFGTGYSSLSYLRNYPFNTLKIDRSFVNDITTDPADLELVNASTTMALNLGLKVVAEGVETEEQLAILTELGCGLAQGNLFSKPVSPEEIPGMLAAVSRLSGNSMP